jgi:hypothetical protein
MKKAVLYLFILISLGSCVTKTSWNLKTVNQNLVIVDATIVDTMGAQQVKLTRTVQELNQPPAAVSGAIVRITDADSTVNLTENPANSGIYLTSDKFIAQLGKTYTLLVFWNDQVYSAKTSMVPGTAFPALHYTKNDDDDLYQIDYIASAFSTDKPAMWEILLDWSKVPGYEQADPAITHARKLFYTLPTLDVGEIFPPPVENISFPAGTVITERRYSLNPDHAAFIRALISETNWQGGLFSSEPANVMTNMSTGAAGWFGACALTSLSLTVTP